MDAIKFIEEKERMCKAQESCVFCPACLDEQCIFGVRSGFAPEQQINTVKAWAEMYPCETRQTAFLKLHPRTRLDSSGVIAVQPCDLGVEAHGCARTTCYMCRKKYWLSPEE